MTTETQPIYTTRSLTEHLATNAAWIADAWPALHESRLKGTPRRWRQTELTPEQRAEIDQRHRTEKAANGAPAGADSPAPLHLDVLDLLVAIDHTSRYGARIIQAHTLNDPPTNTIGRLNYITTNAHLLDPADQDTRHIEQQLRNHRAAITNQWAEVVHGQRLKTGCPWCGHHALYFRAIGPEHQNEIVVRCESGGCNPTDTDCGVWYGGKPCWPFHEWSWLANRIDNEERRQQGRRTLKLKPRANHPN